MIGSQAINFKSFVSYPPGGSNATTCGSYLTT